MFATSHRTIARAGNGTRTRDPNLGKVVLYQLSYSRSTPPNRPEQLPSPSLVRFSELQPPQHWKFSGDGGEGNRTPDLVNAIHALSQLSYAPGDGRVCANLGQPSGTVQYSRVYMACQRNRTSENVYGQYFAAPSKVVADLRVAPQIPRDRGLLTVEMRRPAFAVRRRS